MDVRLLKVQLALSTKYIMSHFDNIFGPQSSIRGRSNSHIAYNNPVWRTAARFTTHYPILQSTNESKAAAIMKFCSRDICAYLGRRSTFGTTLVVPETAEWLKLLPVKSKMADSANMAKSQYLSAIIRCC